MGYNLGMVINLRGFLEICFFFVWIGKYGSSRFWVRVWSIGLGWGVVEVGIRCGYLGEGVRRSMLMGVF